MEASLLPFPYLSGKKIEAMEVVESRLCCHVSKEMHSKMLLTC